MNGEVVSVIIYTYNQEQYIEETVLSVLSQKTDFGYHIYIIDDGSSDNTNIALRKIKKSHSDKITLFLKEKNSGQFSSAEQLFKQIKGKYIAVLDGDDYWIYNQKLQKQVTFLEQNEEYSACFHDLKIKTEKNIENAVLIKKSKQFYKTYSQINNYSEEIYPQQIIERLILPLSSAVFKKDKLYDAYREISRVNKNYKFSFGWIFTLYVIRNSKFYYFNETWGAYRDHKGGVTKYIDNDEFINPIIYFLKKLLLDSYYKNLKTYIYAQLADNTNYLLSNSNILSTFQKRVLSIKIVYYRFLQGIYKVIEINRNL